VTYTTSAYFKKGERDSVTFNFSGIKGKTFNLNLGTVIDGEDPNAFFNNYIGSIINMGNGWFRCIETKTCIQSIVGGERLAITFNNVRSYQGDGVSGLYIWGVQVEELSYATSYIPTTGATATRLGEVVTGGGDVNSINSEEGTLFVEMSALTFGDGVSSHITISDGTLDNIVQLRYFDSNDSIVLVVKSGGVLQGIVVSTPITELKFRKVAMTWKINNFSLYIDGLKIGTDTSGTTLPSDTLNTLSLDNVGTGSPFYGKTKQLRVYKTALTDEELAELTTL
jgi:hypothetical protein